MSLEINLTHLSSPRARLLQAWHLRVPGGVIHSVMGPSGSGKSSLLGAIAGTLPSGMVFDGEVWLNQRRIDTLPTHQRRVGLLFQDALLFAHMTVAQNLLFAVPPGPQAARHASVAQALHDIHLSAFADADPATLSGGQRARVALMRALLAQPQALLLDEPFSQFDATLRQHMRETVFGLIRQRGIAALVVTHDVADVADPAHLSVLPCSTTAPAL